jgi:hypothetical protein
MRSIYGFTVTGLVLLTLSGCASISGKTKAPDCVWAAPISWHAEDTERTKLDVFAHNLKWEEFCLVAE